ncbi:hypothetical protein MTsPCn5_16950 [Croceitalea sp. MTPC5]|uniref:DUF4383 domain-containing protein n=1 Tax=Croceitalea marina TaxID=1775166 RepID=A0ABW5MW36_9FLAO|nr:hypothetical protein MTsPCn5_16950 [Croceitalea sp. MTPC5]
MKLRKTTLYELVVVVGIIVVSTLPYFHDLVADRSGVKPNVPVIGVESFLTGSDGKILGFSSYRVFLYTIMIHLFAHVGFLGWMMDAKGKFYRIALLVPVVLSGYTLAVILFNARQGPFNDVNTKFIITIVTSLGVLVYYILDHRNKLNLKKSKSNHASSEVGN